MTARLMVNINEECSDALKVYARVHDITVTEAVRHAISLLNLLDVQTALGHRFAAVDASGQVITIFDGSAS